MCCSYAHPEDLKWNKTTKITSNLKSFFPQNVWFNRSTFGQKGLGSFGKFTEKSLMFYIKTCQDKSSAEVNQLNFIANMIAI